MNDQGNVSQELCSKFDDHSPHQVIIFIKIVIVWCRLEPLKLELRGVAIRLWEASAPRRVFNIYTSIVVSARASVRIRHRRTVVKHDSPECQMCVEDSEPERLHSHYARRQTNQT